MLTPTTSAQIYILIWHLTGKMHLDLENFKEFVEGIICGILVQLHQVKYKRTFLIPVDQIIYNVIDYVTIASAGNAIDFGDAYQIQEDTSQVLQHQTLTVV